MQRRNLNDTNKIQPNRAAGALFQPATPNHNVSASSPKTSKSDLSNSDFVNRVSDMLRHSLR